MTGQFSRREILAATTAGATVAGLGIAPATAQEEGVLTGDEDVRWRWGPEETDGGTSSLQSDPSPTIANGTLYTTARDVFFRNRESGSGRCCGSALYALDTDAGGLVWHYSGPEGQTFDTDGIAAQVVDGTVYVVSPTSLIALDAATGEKQWEQSIASRANDANSVVVREGTAYLGTSAGLLALDAASGAEEWWYDTEWVAEVPAFEGESTGIMAPPVVVDGRVYCTVNRDFESVLAIDAATGSKVWTYEPRDHRQGGNSAYVVNDASLTVAGDTVYAATSGGEREPDDGDDPIDVFVALDAASGSKRWGTDLDLGEWGPTVHDGTVYGGAVESGTTGLYALDAGSGSVQWTHEIGDGATVRTAPTVADGVVYFGYEGESDGDQALAGVDAATGDAVWSKTVSVGSGDPIAGSSPIVVEGTLYVGTLTGPGGVYAFDVEGDGSSVDSRVRRGSHGHHDVWAWQQESRPASEPTPQSVGGSTETGTPSGERVTSPGATGTDSGSGSTAGGRTQQPADSDSSNRENQEEGEVVTEGTGPGLGVVSTLASIGGVGYLLSRRRDET